MSVDIDCVVVGAGVVGLAVARGMALAGHEVLVIEAGEAIGIGTSSRNSEVIHAGIYYPPGSLKARLCVEGRPALYAYCDSHGVSTRKTGKLIVAKDEAQVRQLEVLLERGRVNGVEDLRLLDREQALALEPALECIAALYSPSTGIVDSHGLMLALQGDAEAAGTTIAFHSPLTNAQVTARALHTSHLPRAGGRRPRGSHDFGPGRPSAFRPGHRMGRGRGLSGRSIAGQCLLFSDSQLLARFTGQQFATRVQRHSPENFRTW
ncbi:FAD dependent oxidoreductase [Pseudomonas sp. NFIX10]|nr:FAD dependent oxidoreductase [Pseudomonas sp. NFIX10]SFF51957.1 FAD dependent oxidoreductase [Pseudomonas sp. NFACC06-1]